MNNHQMMVELAAKNDQTKIHLMEFWDIESPKNKLVMCLYRLIPAIPYMLPKTL